MKVYLAGPITGYDYGIVNSWREEVIDYLKDHGIKGYSPMRGKNYLSKEDMIQNSYEDQTMSSIQAINIRDYNDCKTSDAILVNLLGAVHVSIGTVMEVAWARAFQIPCVIIMERGGKSISNIHEHGMLTYGNIIAPTLEEGVEAIIQILNQ